jgi:hypothetical protein
VKLSTDALYETELAATHQAWELVVELKKSKLTTKHQSKSFSPSCEMSCHTFHALPVVRQCGSRPAEQHWQ